MGFALMIVGLIVALLWSFTVGVLLIVIGIVLLFVPNTYGVRR